MLWSMNESDPSLANLETFASIAYPGGGLKDTTSLTWPTANLENAFRATTDMIGPEPEFVHADQRSGELVAIRYGPETSKAG